MAKKSKVSKKISKLRKEGKPQDQAVAIALSMQKRGKLAKGGSLTQTNSFNLDLEPITQKTYDMKAQYKYGGKMYKKGGGLSRAKNYGSSKKPYPSVKASDFAGGDRSYPIPTKADAIDALRLAGLHNRSDVRAKVYKKYPSLKRAYGGKMYQNGGDMLNTISQLSGSMAPLLAGTGVGMPVAMGISALSGIAGQAMNNAQPKVKPQINYMTQQEAMGFEYGGSMGGQLLPMGPSQYLVQGDNPNMTDGVYLPSKNANVDHNEVINNDYVLSDSLMGPNGKTFAQTAKKYVRKNVRHPQDMITKKTQKVNDLALKMLEQQNEQARMSMPSYAMGGKMYKSGGKMYQIGGNMGDPPNPFDPQVILDNYTKWRTSPTGDLYPTKVKNYELTPSRFPDLSKVWVGQGTDLQGNPLFSLNPDPMSLGIPNTVPVNPGNYYQTGEYYGPIHGKYGKTAGQVTNTPQGMNVTLPPMNISARRAPQMQMDEMPADQFAMTTPELLEWEGNLAADMAQQGFGYPAVYGDKTPLSVMPRPADPVPVSMPASSGKTTSGASTATSTGQTGSGTSTVQPDLAAFDEALKTGMPLQYAGLGLQALNYLGKGFLSRPETYQPMENPYAREIARQDPRVSLDQARTDAAIATNAAGRFIDQASLSDPIRRSQRMSNYNALRNQLSQIGQQENLMNLQNRQQRLARLMNLGERDRMAGAEARQLTEQARAMRNQYQDIGANLLGSGLAQMGQAQIQNQLQRQMLGLLPDIAGSTAFTYDPSTGKISFGG